MENKRLLKIAIKPLEGWIEFEKDTEIGLSEEEGTLYISFQGSLSLTDWVYNFLAWSTLGVHHGILKKWLIVRNVVEEKIRERGGERVVFLGHSQGAGIALLAYLELKEVFKNKDISCITFGCPKILNFWKFLKERKGGGKIKHFKIRTDIVTYLSPVFFQLGEIVYLGKWKLPKISDHFPKAYKELL